MLQVNYLTYRNEFLITTRIVTKDFDSIGNMLFLALVVNQLNNIVVAFTKPLEHTADWQDKSQSSSLVMIRLINLLFKKI